jgi:hypothetical protein
LKRIIQGFCAVLFCFVCGLAAAYEVSTHGYLTYQAYMRSRLVDYVVFQELGLEDGANTFGNFYYDVSSTGVGTRYWGGFEEDIIEEDMKLVNQSLTIPGWLMQGAIREDDIPDYWPFLGENPQDDPDGKIPRVRNHFYDPVNRRPLEIAGVAVGKDAPTWAVGSEEAFRCPNCEDLNRRNHFTVMDAREAMYRALTGQDKFGIWGRI